MSVEKDTSEADGKALDEAFAAALASDPEPAKVTGLSHKDCPACAASLDCEQYARADLRAPGMQYLHVRHQSDRGVTVCYSRPTPAPETDEASR